MEASLSGQVILSSVIQNSEVSKHYPWPVPSRASLYLPLYLFHSKLLASSWSDMDILLGHLQEENDPHILTGGSTRLVWGCFQRRRGHILEVKSLSKN